MSTFSGNIAEKIISKLQTRDIFSSINKNHKKDIPCNLLFLKVLSPDGIPLFAIQEYDYINKIVSTRTPSEDEPGTRLCVAPARRRSHSLEKSRRTT